MAALTDLTPAGVARRLWFVVHNARLVVSEDGAGAALPTDEQARALGAWERAHYLGPIGEDHAFALAADAEPPPPLAARGLRSLFGALDGRLLGAAGRALQAVEWALTSRFCGQCGRPTDAVPGERATRCAACERVYYPRIAPAIIVLVRRGREALLARNARMPSGFYSTLAGFSEIGETLEETLIREVREEVGVEVANPRYFGSQPWPFPHSLMIGFFADWVSGEIRPDPSEIADAQWFSADALPTIPPPITIARWLIDAWLSEVG